MSDTPQYHLYVVRPQDIPADEKHYIITPDWCLLYTSNTPPEPYREVTRLNNLPMPAKQWLDDAIAQVNVEYLKEHEKEVLQKAKSFHDRLAQELAIEQAKMSEKEGEPVEQASTAD